MIMTKQLDAFAEAACRILEDLVFMFGELCEKTDLPSCSELYSMASVDFEGPVVGTCFWIGTEAFCIDLAANMLGVEPDDDSAILGKEDALKELSNVVCCQFLTAVYGSVPLFQLACPVSQQLNAEDWMRYIDNPDTVGIAVDDQSVLVGLVLHTR